MRSRTRVCLDLKNGRRIIGHAPYPRWLVRWLFRRCAAGYGPVIVMHDGNGTHVEVEPGQIAHVLVAAYEGGR
jgi:hypothetical protein